jgi:hypothetical protein
MGWAMTAGAERAGTAERRGRARFFRNVGATFALFGITGELCCLRISHDGPCKELNHETGNHAVNTDRITTNNTAALDTIAAWNAPHRGCRKLGIAHLRGAAYGTPRGLGLACLPAARRTDGIAATARGSDTGAASGAHHWLGLAGRTIRRLSAQCWPDDRAHARAGVHRWSYMGFVFFRPGALPCPGYGMGRVGCVASPEIPRARDWQCAASFPLQTEPISAAFPNDRVQAGGPAQAGELRRIPSVHSDHLVHRHQGRCDPL